MCAAVFTGTEKVALRLKGRKRRMDLEEPRSDSNLLLQFDL